MSVWARVAFTKRVCYAGMGGDLMNDNQIRSFLMAAECASMTQAAQRQYIAVSALKKQIDALEAELGFRLFARSNKGLSLTAEGSAFYDYAAQALTDWGQTVARLREKAAPGEKTIRVVYRTEQIRDHLYYGAYHQFRTLHPNINIVLEHANFFMPGTADLYLGIADPSNRYLLPVLSYDMPLGCIMHKSHPLASKASLRLEDLYGCCVHAPSKEIMRYSEPNPSAELEAHCRVKWVDLLTGFSIFLSNCQLYKEWICLMIGQEPILPPDLVQARLEGHVFKHCFHAPSRTLRAEVRTYLDFIRQYYGAGAWLAR